MAGLHAVDMPCLAMTLLHLHSRPWFMIMLEAMHRLVPWVHAFMQ